MLSIAAHKKNNLKLPIQNRQSC